MTDFQTCTLNFSNQRSYGAGGGPSPPPVSQDWQPIFKNIKTLINARSGLNIANPSGHRAAGARPNFTKTFEHRYERRKIREQLRRLDWMPDAEDKNFA
jgi:hypothetical protein